MTGLEHYPSDKPVILALNHPTAFVEPCILATTLDDELHFLVRGDFFAKPMHNKLLRSFGCLPVFRMKDGGYENIKNNYDTFNDTYQYLGQKKPIVILAEGTSIHEKRLRPIKKGTARLAFGTMEKYGIGTDVHIVPVGVNYTYAEQFRSEVMIEFSEPIKAADYWKQYQENKAAGIKELTDELRRRLEDKVIIIEQETDEELVEQHFTLSRNAKRMPVLPVLSNRGSRFKAEKRIAETVNKMNKAEKAEKKTATQTYFNRIKQLNVSDIGLLRSGSYGRGSLLILFLGFVPNLFGYIFNAPPLFIADSVGKEKVKHIEFRAPVTITAGIVCYMLWWLFLVAVATLIGNVPLLVFAVGMPLTGYFSLIYSEFKNTRKETLRADKLSKDEREELLKMRREILI